MLALPPIGQAVAVGVGAARVAADARLDRVGDPVVVGVAIVRRAPGAGRRGGGAEARAGVEGHTDRRGGQRCGAGERREAARSADRVAADTGPRMANEVRRGGEPLPDVAVPAQGRPPGEGQHVMAEAHEAPARECAGDGNAEH